MKLKLYIEGLSVKGITTTITERGQGTIPAEVCRLLGLKPGNKVSFYLESAYGSVKPSRKSEDFEEISQVVKDEKAEKTARKSSTT